MSGNVHAQYGQRTKITGCHANYGARTQSATFGILPYNLQKTAQLRLKAKKSES